MAAIKELKAGATKSACVKVERKGRTLEYTLQGDIDRVNQAIGELFERYHPAGYGTKIVRRGEANGGVWVVISRSDSCD